MAGLGAKLFTANTVLTAAQVNGYLADQAIMRFASSVVRDAAFGGAGEPTLAEGMTCYLDDTNVLQSYTGSAWVEIASSDGKAPRGILALRTRTTSSSTLSAATVTIAAVNFTAVANRYYKVTYYEPQANPGGASTFAQMEIRNGTTTAGTLLQSASVPQSSGVRAATTCTYVSTFTAGSVNVVAVGYPNGGTVTFVCQADNFAFLMVEDIGSSL